ncbi:MAG: hypothetical protein H6586_06645 [Flavobacteriales bacterium]|nr:hypothetical protein [Flavobacteriales bacterium]
MMDKLYDIRDKPYNHEEYNNFIETIQPFVNHASNIISDSSQHENIISLGRTKEDKKSLKQSIKIFYFDYDSLTSFHISCRARMSLTGIDWDTDNRFDTYPPKSALLLDSNTVSLTALKHIYPEINTNKNDVIIIFWTSILWKLSLEAMYEVEKNLIKFNKVNKVDIVLINVDIVYS